MKKAKLILILAIIFSLINISLAQADIIITVKYSDGCYVHGALVEVYHEGLLQIKCLGYTNKYGSFTCTSEELYPDCPYNDYRIKVWKPDDSWKDMFYATVDSNCNGNPNKTSTLTEDTCLSMEGKKLCR